MMPNADRLILDQFIPYRLSVASNAVSTRISQSYRQRFGLSVPQWRAIAILAENTAMTSQALSRATRMDKINVSRAAAALVARGLVSDRENPGDGRSHLLALTRDGEALYAQIAPLACELERALLQNFTPQERALLDTLLRRIEGAAQQ